MSYARGTQNYNLPQTQGTDKRDWSDTNAAFLAIDTAIKTANTTASSASSAASTAQSRADSAYTLASTANTAAGNAATAAATADEKAVIAKNRADSAYTAASNAQTTANSKVGAWNSIYTGGAIFEFSTTEGTYQNNALKGAKEIIVIPVFPGVPYSNQGMHLAAGQHRPSAMYLYSTRYGNPNFDNGCVISEFNSTAGSFKHQSSVSGGYSCYEILYR